MEAYDLPDWLKSESALADAAIAELHAALEQSRPGSPQWHRTLALLQVWRQQLGNTASRNTPVALPEFHEDAKKT